MKNLGIKISLFINYFVFAILLNSVGAVILQVQRNFEITKSAASILEGFKDLPIAIFSFLLASFIPKIGYKKSMIIALIMVIISSFVMPFADNFWFFKIQFFLVGVSFALIKVSVYATIGLVTNNKKEHSSFMSLLEGFFMIGVLLGNVLFSLFIDDANPKSEQWLNVYWILGVLSIIALLFLSFAKLDERGTKIEGRALSKDFSEMLKMILLPLVLVFILCVFLYVLIEQSFQTWTPTFYKNILKVPASMSIQAGAVLAGAFALGRFMAGIALKKIHWIYVVTFCIVMTGVIVLIVLPLTHHIKYTANMTWFKAPFVAYLFPIMGIFLAPIYPAVNSVILSSLPKHMHSSMSGLIVVFSALGGTTGSIITGHVFDYFDGQTAFYFSLIPMFLLLITLQMFNRIIKKNAIEN
jgi:fucose permease